MEKNKAPADFSGRLWNFFKSVKLTVFVLLTLAATSIIGTVIPQNQDPALYLHKFGEVFYRAMNTLGIFDMYHSWWFVLLLLTLSANILVCSIDRFISTRKIIFNKEPKFNVERFRRLKEKRKFEARQPSEFLMSAFTPFIAKNFRYSKVKQLANGYCIFAEKGRWTRLGVYVVHFGVMLLILGALIGSLFGFDSYVNIAEGESVNHVMLRKTGQMNHLPFEIRCDDFELSLYDTGQPSEYRSTLTILQDGEPIISKDVVVNDPLRHNGVNIFQSSYGVLPPKEITLEFSSPETGTVYTKKLLIGEHFDIPENMGRFVITKLLNSYNFMGHNIGECIAGTLTTADNKVSEIIVPFRFPGFDKMRKSAVSVSIKDFTKIYYTGLLVTRDPGVPVVYASFLITIVGIFIAFFMSHQRLCIIVEKEGSRSQVTVSGMSNRENSRMERKVKKISQWLVKMTQDEPRRKHEIINTRYLELENSLRQTDSVEKG